MAMSSVRVRVVKAQFQVTINATPTAKKKAFQTVAREMDEELHSRIDDPAPPASSPGQPPHRDSGYLYDETSVRAKGSTIKVRTPQYGIWLEGGTRKMAARPFIRPTIHGKPKFWGKRLNMHAKREMVKAAKLKKTRPKAKRR